MKAPEKTEHNRIELLENFRNALRAWFDGELEGWKSKEDLRSFINRNLKAARTAVLDVGCLGLMNIAPPSAVGGVVMKNVDPFAMVFQSMWGHSVIPTLLDQVEQAIGSYEHLRDETSLIRLRRPEIIDIESALERALRPSFKKSAPTSEREVQDSVETILQALGVNPRREDERAPVGPKSFIPDFTVPDLKLAIEVKLAKDNHGSSKIQDELSADIAAYSTQWDHLLAIIYDLGVIADPHTMRADNLKHFGVSVLIIKQ